MENEDIPLIMTPKVAADILGIKASTIYTAIALKTIRFRRPKHTPTGITITRDALIEYRDRTQPDGVVSRGRPKKGTHTDAPNT